MERETTGVQTGWGSAWRGSSGRVGREKQKTEVGPREEVVGRFVLGRETHGPGTGNPTREAGV